MRIIPLTECGQFRAKLGVRDEQELHEDSEFQKCITKLQGSMRHHVTGSGD